MEKRFLQHTLGHCSAEILKDRQDFNFRVAAIAATNSVPARIETTSGWGDSIWIADNDRLSFLDAWAKEIGKYFGLKHYISAEQLYLTDDLEYVLFKTFDKTVNVATCMLTINSSLLMPRPPKKPDKIQMNYCFIDLPEEDLSWFKLTCMD